MTGLTKCGKVGNREIRQIHESEGRDEKDMKDQKVKGTDKMTGWRNAKVGVTGCAKWKQLLRRNGASVRLVCFGSAYYSGGKVGKQGWHFDCTENIASSNVMEGRRV
jgi:hypothetical protein